MVRGYASEEVSDARALLQPLMLRYGFDAVERGGCLSFRMRDGESDHLLSDEDLVRDEEGAAPSKRPAPMPPRSPGGCGFGSSRRMRISR